MSLTDRKLADFLIPRGWSRWPWEDGQWSHKSNLTRLFTNDEALAQQRAWDDKARAVPSPFMWGADVAERLGFA